MALTRYLADTSVLARLERPRVADAVTPLLAANQIACCPPVQFELQYMAPNARAIDGVRHELGGFPTVEMRPWCFDRALEVQALAARKGFHRALSLVDLLVAAAAEMSGLTVLHYDADFDKIAKLTGQPTEWVVKRGTAE